MGVVRLTCLAPDLFSTTQTAQTQFPMNLGRELGNIACCVHHATAMREEEGT